MTAEETTGFFGAVEKHSVGPQKSEWGTVPPPRAITCWWRRRNTHPLWRVFLLKSCQFEFTSYTFPPNTNLTFFPNEKYSAASGFCMANLKYSSLPKAIFTTGKFF
jgi:hypothetical protein